MLRASLSETSGYAIRDMHIRERVLLHWHYMVTRSCWPITALFNWYKCTLFSRLLQQYSLSGQPVYATDWVPSRLSLNRLRTHTFVLYVFHQISDQYVIYGSANEQYDITRAISVNTWLALYIIAVVFAMCDCVVLKCSFQFNLSSIIAPTNVVLYTLSI